MANYKIGQILTANRDIELERSLSGEKVKIPKGANAIIGADGYAHHFYGGFLQHVGTNDKIEGFDAPGIAYWLYLQLSSRFDLDRMLEDDEYNRHDFEDAIAEALEEIGLNSPDEED